MPDGQEALAVRAGRFYTEMLGFALTPIQPRSKRPYRVEWNRRENLVTTPGAVAREYQQGEGWGFCHGFSGTAAVDADLDLDMVDLALAAAGIDYHGLLAAGTPCIIGNPQKPPKLILRIPEGVILDTHKLKWPSKEDPSRLVTVVELRAGSVQDVLPPTVHPGTSQPYRWTPRWPCRREDFPEVPPTLLRLWLAWSEHLGAMERACPWAEPPPPEPPRAPPRPRPVGEDSIIERWNSEVDPAVVLKRNDYKQKAPKRWLAPGSTTKDPGVVVLDGRVYSHHGSDVLADGFAHDAFDLLRVLEHHGDGRAAAKAASRELGRTVLYNANENTREEG